MLVVHAEVTLANLADGWFGPRRLDRRQRHLPHTPSVICHGVIFIISHQHYVDSNLIVSDVSFKVFSAPSRPVQLYETGICEVQPSKSISGHSLHL